MITAFSKSVLVLLWALAGATVFAQTLTADETALYNLLMDYRKVHGLPVIPVSRSLTQVAQTHVRDLDANQPDRGPCNSHSWSDKGTWSPCCYTEDHAQAQCMWDKPRELTGYPGSGFEIACGASDPMYGDFVMTPAYALKSWQDSPGHNGVILNEGMWNEPWNAVGIGLYKGFAVVWFGMVADTR